MKPYPFLSLNHYYNPFCQNDSLLSSVYSNAIISHDGKNIFINQTDDHNFCAIEIGKNYNSEDMIFQDVIPVPAMCPSSWNHYNETGYMILY